MIDTLEEMTSTKTLIAQVSSGGEGVLVYAGNMIDGEKLFI